MFIFKLSKVTQLQGILVTGEDTAHGTWSTWCSTQMLTWLSHSPRTSVNLEQCISTGAPNRHFWLSWQERCYWHLVGRDQGCCQILPNTQYSSSRTKTYLVQNVSSAKTKKPWYRPSSQTRLYQLPSLRCSASSLTSPQVTSILRNWHLD